MTRPKISHARTRFSFEFKLQLPPEPTPAQHHSVVCPPIKRMDPPISMRISGEFSTNRHSAQSKPQQLDVPECLARHPDICFEDGNIAIVTGSEFFLVHQGVLTRRSDNLGKLVQQSIRENSRLVEGRPFVRLEDSPADMANFLQALYDGMYDT